VAAVEPIVVQRAEGATVWDADGTAYLDCFAGIAVVNAGHRHPRVLAAVHEQLEQVIHAATYLYHVPVVADLAEQLARIAPGDLTKTFFGNSGAEGIETAIRFAKAYTGRHEIITLTHSFHGRTAGTLSITGNGARKTRGGPYLPGVAFAPAPYVYRNPFGTDDPEIIAERCAEMVEWAIVYQSSGDVAAFHQPRSSGGSRKCWTGTASSSSPMRSRADSGGPARPSRSNISTWCRTSW
jgi:4-aminobutyrate aminotransferase-like enzyme